VSIEFELKGSVGWVTLARPKAMNALNREMVDGMTERLQAWAERSGRARRRRDRHRSRPSAPAPTSSRRARRRAGRARLPRCDRGVLRDAAGLSEAGDRRGQRARAGGGMEIVLACDFVIAAQSARFGDAHSNFGVFPGGGGAAIMPRKLPANVAMYLLFTGDSLPADEMKTHGLVSEVVADAELAARVQAIGEKLATRARWCSPA
jgi:enoyl-CoA hydratase/carnithine racemase